MVNNIQNRQRRWLLSYRRTVILIFHKKQQTCFFFYYLLHRVTLLMTWNKKIFFAKREKNSVLSSSIQLGGISRFRLLGISGLGGINTFWVQKIRPEKLLKFTKILNYIKFSYFMNYFKYFPIYILG